MIYPISPAELDEEFLHRHIYPDLDHTYYWSRLWEPEFYVALARAGFISISHCDPEVGPVLIPELQEGYAVLDWENLRMSSRIRKLLRSGRMEEDAIELRIVDRCDAVLDRIRAYHAATWLIEPYREMLARLPAAEPTGFSLHGVELWSNRQKRLVAGEIGYSIGRTYTSLSGFCTRPAREWRGFGTLQMVLLAKRLQEQGYAFWNMGHPKLAYKLALGARVLDREAFLARWLEERDRVLPSLNPLQPSSRS